MRTQNRLAGGRVNVQSGLHPEVERWIRREMRRFNVSRAFVVATLITDQFERITGLRIKDQARFDHPVEITRRRRSA